VQVTIPLVPVTSQSLAPAGAARQVSFPFEFANVGRMKLLKETAPFLKWSAVFRVIRQAPRT
jgi:hypothetical protein